MLNENSFNILVILTYVAILLHIFAFVRCTLNKYNINIDIMSMNKKNSKIFNGWALSHLLLYVYIGYHYPDNYLFVIIIGILWEIYEYNFSTNDIFINNIYIGLCGIEDGYHQMIHNIYDPFINLLGYYIGIQLRNLK